MVRVYSSPNAEMVHLVKTALKNEDIDCVVRGEHAAAVVGGGSGIDAWVELWVLSEYQAEEARTLVEQMLQEADDVDDPWICPDCIEWREGQFSHCWKCGAERIS